MSLNMRTNIELTPHHRKGAVPFVVVFGSDVPLPRFITASGPFGSQVLQIEMKRLTTIVCLNL